MWLVKIARFLPVLLAAALWLAAAGPGFRSGKQLDEHYRKHGAEFGEIARAEYLRLAQELRDAPAGGNILEAVRPDGVITRFDRRRKSFGAYNPDKTIRTFFIPTQGEKYFWRQARRGKPRQ
jgi:pyocin large subunit-like protein